jgi:hypothetical protein
VFGGRNTPPAPARSGQQAFHRLHGVLAYKDPERTEDRGAVVLVRHDRDGIAGVMMIHSLAAARTAGLS